MIRKLQWKIAWWWNMHILKSGHVIIAFPIITELSLNKEHYKAEFMKGRKLRHIVTELAENNLKKMTNVMKSYALKSWKAERRASKSEKERIKFLARYQRFCNFYRMKREAEELDKAMKNAECAFEKLKAEKN